MFLFFGSLDVFYFLFMYPSLCNHFPFYLENEKAVHSQEGKDSSTTEK